MASSGSYVVLLMTLLVPLRLMDAFIPNRSRSSLAPALGHNLVNGIPKQFKTAGGIAIGYSHTTRIEIYDLNDRLLYAINETPIDFMPQLHIPLLGVRQFLDRFELHVHYPKKTFSIKYPT